LKVAPATAIAAPAPPYAASQRRIADAKTWLLAGRGLASEGIRLPAAEAFSPCQPSLFACPPSTAPRIPSSEQNKLQAAAHWARIADRAADEVVASLGLGASCATAPAPCPLVYVRPPPQPTDFARGFHSALITALLRQKVAVSLGPGDTGAISLDIDIQTIRFSANRPDGRFLPFSALYAGGWGAYGLAKNAAPAAAGLAGLAVAGGIDIYRWNVSDWASGPTPQTELIVTVSASDGQRYLGRVSNVYYVADRDASLYLGPPQLYDIAVGGDR
jgi:hypothetical protein